MVQIARKQGPKNPQKRGNVHSGSKNSCKFCAAPKPLRTFKNIRHQSGLGIPANSARSRAFSLVDFWKTLSDSMEQAKNIMPRYSTFLEKKIGPTDEL